MKLVFTLLLITSLTPCLAMSGEGKDKPPDFSFSYSLTIAKHSIVVTVMAGGKSSLVVDGKPAKNSPEFGQPSMGIGKLGVAILGPIRSLFFSIGQGEEVVVDVRRKGKEFQLPKTAEKIKVGKKIVLREKSTTGGPSDAPPVIVYDFYYRISSGGLVYDLTQSIPTKTMTEEFKQAVETLKPRRVKK